MNKEKSIIGCLMGGVVGDCLGLPFEFLAKNRQLKLFKNRKDYHFFFNKGMFSDDSEHSFMVAKSLIYAKGDLKEFEKNLAWRLRFWLLGLPAGIGMATLKSIIKLWLGFNPKKSGVFSAGNGPAMRAAIIGVTHGAHLDLMLKLLKISTNMTHTDPKAYYGAVTVAYATYYSSINETINFNEFLIELKNILKLKIDDEYILLLDKINDSVDNHTIEEFVKEFNFEKGISGYIFHTITAVLYIWCKHYNDYIGGLKQIIELGGDTDTTGAILGGIIGARVGIDGIPKELRKNIFDFCRNEDWIVNLGKSLANSDNHNKNLKINPLNIVLILIRNLLFMVIVLLHGFRRLFPPY